MLTLAELTKELAVELTAICTEIFRAEIDPERWTTRLTSANACLTVSLDESHKQKRVKVWASTPQGIAPLSDYEVITLSADRTPAAMAQDIKRRLYDHAKEYLIECTTRQNETDKQNRKEELIRKLLKPYLPHEGMYKKLYSNDAPSIRAEIRSTYIEMKIDATPTQAIKILKLLKG